jgi:hypothetical protein
MMTLTRLRVFCTVNPFRRMGHGAAVLALFACLVLPQCVAAKLHQHRTSGVYLTHDSKILQSLARHAPGTYWIDGYQMSFSARTQICWHDAVLQFSPILDRDGQAIRSLNEKSPCKVVPSISLKQSAWLQYLGIQKYISDYRLTSKMNVVASRIDIWRVENGENQLQTGPKQTWRTLCASTSPHELRYQNEGSISVVCDAGINNYIENLFSSLLKPSETMPDALITKQEARSFYVVKPFEVMHNYDFETIDGSAAICGLQGTLCTYQCPPAHSMVHEIVYAPDGTVLIPDIALAHLKNEAEFAALLSYSLVTTDQRLIGHLFRAQHYMGGRWSSSGRRNGLRIGQFIWNLNEQVLRLGIQQMYLAGFDARYAPLAWEAEQDKRIKTPLAVSDYKDIKHIPTFAAYGFHYIGQLYSDVDYSKLKRGEAEYAQFLDELRKADPEAFAEKK